MAYKLTWTRTLVSWPLPGFECAVGRLFYSLIKLPDASHSCKEQEIGILMMGPVLTAFWLTAYLAYVLLVFELGLWVYIWSQYFHFWSIKRYWTTLSRMKLNQMKCSNTLFYININYIYIVYFPTLCLCCGCHVLNTGCFTLQIPCRSVLLPNAAQKLCWQKWTDSGHASGRDVFSRGYRLVLLEALNQWTIPLLLNVEGLLFSWVKLIIMQCLVKPVWNSLSVQSTWESYWPRSAAYTVVPGQLRDPFNSELLYVNTST